MAPIVLVHGAWHGGWCDAFLPEPGRSMFDVLRPERRDLFQEQARRSGGLVPSPPPQAFGVTDPADAEWVAARLCPQPVRTFAQPLVLAPAPALPRTHLPRTRLPRTYLHCTAGAVVATFAPFAERVRDDPAWDYAELDAGHDVMLTAPDVLAAALPVGP